LGAQEADWECHIGSDNLGPFFILGDEVNLFYDDTREGGWSPDLMEALFPRTGAGQGGHASSHAAPLLLCRHKCTRQPPFPLKLGIFTVHLHSKLVPPTPPLAFPLNVAQPRGQGSGSGAGDDLAPSHTRILTLEEKIYVTLSLFFIFYKGKNVF
jgi:hypothetical protein